MALLVLTSGCGIPSDDEPRPLAGTVLVPPRSTPSGSPSRAGDPEADVARIALLGPSEQLVLVERTVGAADPAAAVAGLLSALAAGPSTDELAAGLSSAIPAGATLRLVSLSDGLAEVDVGGEDADAAADRLPLTVAQIVVTVDGGPAVDAVRFTREGVPVEAPLPGGELSADPLTAADYASLLAPPPVPGG